MEIKKFQFLVGKLTHNEGFTLIEALITLLCISTFLSIFFAHYQVENLNYYTFPDEYFYLQTEAMRNAKTVCLDREEISGIHWNQNGNVNHAITVPFENQKEIVIELGGGRLVYR